MRTFAGPDGTPWGVELILPGASNALVYFRHPDARSARLDRYGWYLHQGPEARNVTARLDPQQVLEKITDGELAGLFRRSMPVSSDRSLVGAAAGRGEPAPR